jgi:dihydropteroate synthase
MRITGLRDGTQPIAPPAGRRASLRVLAMGRPLPLDARPLVMGVLNVTPDSFFDGGRFLDPGAAVARALAMEEEGADLIDIGAESSRPGAPPIEEGEELRRLMPVLEALAGKLAIPVSVDTAKAGVARTALAAGASLVNDITALRGDAGMGRLIATTGAGLVLMHMQGTPATMQRAPRYTDVVGEVRRFFGERLRAASDEGIAPEQIILDPGIGFGKNLQHNLALLANLEAFEDFGRPLLVGVSRKAFIGQILDRAVEGRLAGTAAAVALAVLHGARLVRVHDVRAMKDAVRMVEAVERERAGSHS